MSLVRIEKLWTLFFVMGVLGWVYETVLEVFVYQWGFSNRGILFGPWLPIYGIGGLLFVGGCYTVVKSDLPLAVKLLMVFVITALIATAVELGATYILEAVNGEWPWDYTKYDIQFQGRIALSTSIRFGLCGLLGMFVVYPAVECVTERLRGRVMTVFCTVTACLFVADLVYLVC